MQSHHLPLVFSVEKIPEKSNWHWEAELPACRLFSPLYYRCRRNQETGIECTLMIRRYLQVADIFLRTEDDCLAKKEMSFKVVRNRRVRCVAAERHSAWLYLSMRGVPLLA